jgi:hypothetical protein
MRRAIQFAKPLRAGCCSAIILHVAWGFSQ